MVHTLIYEKNLLNNKLPSALKSWNFLLEKIENKNIILLLDYDGTLVPIAAKPELAVINDDKKDMLYNLSKLYLTVIVSGRLLSEQINLIGREGIYYICNHGFDIKLPFLTETNLQNAAGFNADIKEAYSRLKVTLGQIKGIFIEYKRYSLSIHYRLVEKEAIEYIESSIDNIIENQFRLKKDYAKKVFEIRPNVEWSIEQAIKWLVNKLNLQKDTLFPIYIGDDVTDESGFKAVSGSGISIIVAEQYRPTFANYSLKNVTEVWEFLNKLMILRKY